MKILQSLPPQVSDALKASGESADSLVLALPTDINLKGAYAPQWLLASTRSIWVMDEHHPDSQRVAIPFSEIKEIRTLSVVGSGLLQAKSGGAWIDLVRYSNRLSYPFSRTCRRLEQLRKGETVVLVSEDETDPRQCSSCGLMLGFVGESCPRCVSHGKAFTRIMQLMRPYWKAALVMTGLLICGIALDMVTPLLTRYLVDDVLVTTVAAPATVAEVAGGALPAAASGGGMQWLTNIKTPATLLLVVVGALAGVQVLRSMLYVFNGRLASRVGTSITYDVRGRLVEHLERLSLSYYDQQQTGSLVGRVAYDTEAVQGFVAQLTGGFLMQLLLVIVSAAMMFSLEPHLALWTLVPAPFVLASTFVFYRFVQPHYRRFWDRSSKQAGMLSGMLAGIRVVKAFAQEDREFTRYQQSSALLRDARRDVDVAAASFYPVMGLVFQCGGWIVWYVGGRDVLGGQMSLGTLMAFFGYLGMFYGPLSQLTNMTSWVTQFSTQMHRIFEVLDTPVGVPDAVSPVPLKEMKGEITFDNVTFGYSRQTPIVKNLDITVTAGEMIGVVGHSGSGKTTLINLVSRFYDVDEGRILIDGHDIRQISKSDLRSQIGVVLQEPFLFRGTLWENLTYGRQGSSIDAVFNASRAANAHDFVMRQPHGYDTWVGERGAGLSGGERQRLSIARALLCDPRILILDEATSSIDSESEVAFQRALEHLVRGRTCIAIAHRLSTLRNCNRIFVVDEGHIIEAGSHTELMKLGGKYAKLVRLQSNVSREASVDDLKHHDETPEEIEAKEKAAAATAATGGNSAPLAALTIEVNPENGLTPISAHPVRWLTPGTTTVAVGQHGALQVMVQGEATYAGVFALRCMPVRYPESYISLRFVNSENKEQEIGIVKDLTSWPTEMQTLLRESMMRRYFVHTVSRVLSIKQLESYLDFVVETDFGTMEFTMHYSTEVVQDYGDGGKMLSDMSQNRYLIPKVANLPTVDRSLFVRYIYW